MYMHEGINLASYVISLALADSLNAPPSRGSFESPRQWLVVLGYVPRTDLVTTNGVTWSNLYMYNFLSVFRTRCKVPNYFPVAFARRAVASISSGSVGKAREAKPWNQPPAPARSFITRFLRSLPCAEGGWTQHSRSLCDNSLRPPLRRRYSIALLLSFRYRILLRRSTLYPCPYLQRTTGVLDVWTFNRVPSAQ
jgi:hypothetical protein